MQAKKELVLFLILMRAPRDNSRIVGKPEVTILLVLSNGMVRPVGP